MAASATPGRGSPVMERAYQYLADGQWHDYEELVTALMVLVPPSKAARSAESTRVGLARRRARARGEKLPPGYKPLRVEPVSRQALVRSGARAMVRKALNSARFEVDPPGHPQPGQRKRIRDPHAGR